MAPTNQIQTDYQPGDFADSLWLRLAPWQIAGDPAFREIAACLQSPETRALLAELESRGEYPEAVRRQLQELQLGRFFSRETAAHPGITVPHAATLSCLMASISTSLNITVGINGLAFLPVYLGGSEAQLDWLQSRIDRGAFGAMMFSELRHGSNLLRNETCAEPGRLIGGAFRPLEGGEGEATHYRLSGEKQLINGGSRHEVIVVFARTKHYRDIPPETDALRARSDFSIFMLERDATTEALPRWQTVPARGADIAGTRFHGTIVPAEQRIGREGSGFTLAQKALAITRGAMGAMAAGLAARATALSAAHAAQRNIYGRPILHLGAIGDHLLKMRARELLITSMGIKAAAAANARGAGAVHYGAVAKYACCALEEELVSEGRYIHSARSLLREHPYHRVIADAPLYGIFDGTSHLMLEQLQWRLAQLAMADIAHDNPLRIMKNVYAAAPENLIRQVREQHPALLVSPLAYLNQLAEIPGEAPLAPLARVAHSLLAFTRRCREAGAWEDDPGLRFEAGKLLAWLETLIAAVELSDPDRRRELEMEAAELDSKAHRALYRYTLGWFGGRIAAGIDRLLLQCGLEDLPGLKMAERSLWEQAGKARQVIHKNIHWLI